MRREVEAIQEFYWLAFFSTLQLGPYFTLPQARALAIGRNRE